MAASDSAWLLRKILGNVIESPEDARYRKLRMSNDKIAALLATDGARDTLVGAGFIEQGDFLVMPDDADIERVQTALAALAQAPDRAESQTSEHIAGASALGCAMCPSDLLNIWSEVAQHGLSLPTVEFYGHSSGHYRAFSNFFEHAPFTFTVPDSCGRAELEAAGRSAETAVTFSEKAIMLCKAAIMGDYRTYDEIVRASNPRAAKSLGRAVSPWKQRRWDALVLPVARAVVCQKFAAMPHLAELLLATGDRVIAEMTSRDVNWGTGLDVGHADGSRPARWRGTNILGYALICAREELRSERGVAAHDTARQQGQRAAATELRAVAKREAVATDDAASCEAGGAAAEETVVVAGSGSPGPAGRKGKARRAGRLQ